MVKKRISLIILFILSLFIGHGILNTTFGEYSANWTFYVGICSLVLLWIFYLLKVNRFRTVLGITLILGTLNLIEFSHIHWTSTFSWTPPGHVYKSIGINPIITSILILFIFSNSSKIGSIVSKLTSKDEEENIEAENSLVNKFKEKLKNESETKLTSIIENPKDFQSEFVRAAKELLADRF